ncbi:MAG: tetratricopeptide repeat protein [Gammaproteobacteria bacterium]|jgi:TolB-like protein/Tfp pilus assembly protein PilF|nr:tetratricopeptide repeat protein [Gammaproteobacteria bacterium]
MKLLSELKRRNVLRAGAAYIVTAWLVIQVVETILPAFGFGDSAVRYVTITLMIGIVPVVVLSWVFEWTPEGLRRDADVEPGDSIAPRTGRLLDRMIIVVLALGLAYFGFDKFVLAPARDDARASQVAEQIDEARREGRSDALIESFGDNSIAVLPFVNMSADPEQEYFSDGISEELLNLLAQIPELRVISRSSAFAFKGKDINIVDVGRQLNVAHVLEGSVRKSGDRIRITAQLIESGTDTHMWSQTYDRTMGDVFAIQDDIAAVVVERLKLEILGEEPVSRPVDPDAYELFLQARHLARSGSDEGLETAIDLYHQTLVIDPDYVAAWDHLAVAYDNRVAMGLLPVEEGALLARRATERALELDPDYAPAYTELAWIAMQYDNDLAAAARHLERAQQLDPDNTSTLGVTAVLLNNLARLPEALAINRYTLSRDPLNSAVLHNTGAVLFRLERFDEALESWGRLLELQPDHVGTHYFLGLVRLYKGEPDAALVEFQGESFEPLSVAGKAMAFHALGRIDEYESSLQTLIDRWGVDAASAVARVYATTGQIDPAFEWLEKMVESGNGGQINPIDPGFEALSDDARWNELLERVNKAPEQLEAIEFDVRLPAEGASVAPAPI